jgi:hypothetical protein
LAVGALIDSRERRVDGLDLRDVAFDLRNADLSCDVLGVIAFTVASTAAATSASS